MNIVLLGYMGSGKSTVGKVLAQELDYEFYDLDEVIEKREKMSIAHLFEDKGEIYFRRLETIVLTELLENKQDSVIALGGGTPCYANNMKVLSDQKALSIYLKVALPELVVRLKNEKTKRPLIKHIPDEELEEFIGKHLFERSFFYHKAQHVLATGKKTVAEITTAIKALL